MLVYRLIKRTVLLTPFLLMMLSPALLYAVEDTPRLANHIPYGSGHIGTPTPSSTTSTPPTTEAVPQTSTEEEFWLTIHHNQSYYPGAGLQVFVYPDTTFETVEQVIEARETWPSPADNRTCRIPLSDADGSQFELYQRECKVIEDGGLRDKECVDTNYDDALNNRPGDFYPGTYCAIKVPKDASVAIRANVSQQLTFNNCSIGPNDDRFIGDPKPGRIEDTCVVNDLSAHTSVTLHLDAVDQESIESLPVARIDRIQHVITEGDAIQFVVSPTIEINESVTVNVKMRGASGFFTPSTALNAASDNDVHTHIPVLLTPAKPRVVVTHPTDDDAQGEEDATVEIFIENSADYYVSVGGKTITIQIRDNDPLPTACNEADSRKIALTVGGDDYIVENVEEDLFGRAEQAREITFRTTQLNGVLSFLQRKNVNPSGGIITLENTRTKLTARAARTGCGVLQICAKWNDSPEGKNPCDQDSSVYRTFNVSASTTPPEDDDSGVTEEDTTNTPAAAVVPVSGIIDTTSFEGAFGDTDSVFDGLVTDCGHGLGNLRCDFGHLLAVLNTILEIGVYIALVMLAVVLLYAGGVLIISPTGTQKAKKVIMFAAGGLLVVLSAWGIVELIFTTLKFDDTLYDRKELTTASRADRRLPDQKPLLRGSDLSELRARVLNTNLPSSISLRKGGSHTLDLADYINPEWHDTHKPYVITIINRCHSNAGADSITRDSNLVARHYCSGSNNDSLKIQDSVRGFLIKDEEQTAVSTRLCLL